MTSITSENDSPSAGPDRLQLGMLATSLFLAVCLGLQKWMIAPRIAHLIQDFGLEAAWLTRLVVLTPRIFALPLMAGGIVAAVLCLVSRRAGWMVVAMLIAGNILMAAAMLTVEAKVHEALS